MAKPGISVQINVLLVFLSCHHFFFGWVESLGFGGNDNRWLGNVKCLNENSFFEEFLVPILVPDEFQFLLKREGEMRSEFKHLTNTERKALSIPLKRNSIY